MPKDCFCEMKGAEILGLASGGGQQMPIPCLGRMLQGIEKQLKGAELTIQLLFNYLFF